MANIEGWKAERAGQFFLETINCSREHVLGQTTNREDGSEYDFDIHSTSTQADIRVRYQSLLDLGMF
jgi:hypothetical protein